MAGVALLVDFDLDDPLEPVAPEADHDDLSLMEPFPDEIEDISGRRRTDAGLSFGCGQ